MLLDHKGIPLNLSQHNSLEHAIGEEIPAPTIILPNAGVASLGSSSIPAREDHRHTGGIPVYANAAARDAAITSPVYGDQAILDDVDILTMYNGTKWINITYFGAWTTYNNPTVTQSNTLTYTQHYSIWKHEGSHVFWKCFLEFTNSGTFANFIVVTLPVAMVLNERVAGTAQFYDSNTAIRHILQPEVYPTTATIAFGGPTTNNSLFGTTPNVVAASGDQLRIDAHYYALQ